MITPLDIHNKEFKRSLRGYDIDEVDEFLDEIIRDYEKLYKENLDLKDEADKYQSDINKYKELEDTLHNTLVLAQQTADELKKNAQKEADLIIQKAQKEAENVASGTNQKVVDLKLEYRQLKSAVQQFRAQYKAFLQAQLEMITDDKKDIFKKQGESVVISKAE